MSPRQDQQQRKNKAGTLTQHGIRLHHEACQNEAQLLSQRIKQLEKAAKKLYNGNIVSSQASGGQQQTASHKAKGSILHSQATLIESQGKIVNSMYKEQATQA